MCSICSWVVNFWWIFIRESIIIVMSYIIVCIYDDFMVCKIIVIYRVIDYEMVSWVDEEFSCVWDKFSRKNWFNDSFYYCFN